MVDIPTEQADNISQQCTSGYSLTRLSTYHRYKPCLLIQTIISEGNHIWHSKKRKIRANLKIPHNFQVNTSQLRITPLLGICIRWHWWAKTVQLTGVVSLVLIPQVFLEGYSTLKKGGSFVFNLHKRQGWGINRYTFQRRISLLHAFSRLMVLGR